MEFFADVIRGKLHGVDMEALDLGSSNIVKCSAKKNQWLLVVHHCCLKFGKVLFLEAGFQIIY